MSYSDDYFCRYSTMLGVPGKGVHTHVCDVAIVDVVLTALTAYFIQYLSQDQYPFVCNFIGLMILGTFLHWLFCVKTTFTTYIGLN